MLQFRTGMIPAITMLVTDFDLSMVNVIFSATVQSCACPPMDTRRVTNRSVSGSRVAKPCLRPTPATSVGRCMRDVSPPLPPPPPPPFFHTIPSSGELSRKALWLSVDATASITSLSAATREREMNTQVPVCKFAICEILGLRMELLRGRRGPDGLSMCGKVSACRSLLAPIGST